MSKRKLMPRDESERKERTKNGLWRVWGVKEAELRSSQCPPDSGKEE